MNPTKSAPPLAQANPFSFPQRLLSSVRDTVTIALATIAQIRTLLLIALAFGIAFPVFIHTPRRSTAVLVVAVTIAYSAASAFGVRLLRDTPQRSFYYSRPVGAAALWWGGLLASVSAALLMGTAVLAPTMLIEHYGKNGADFGPGVLWAAAGLPLTVLFFHGFMSLFEPQTNWRFLSVPLAVLVGAAFYLAYSMLALKSIFSPAQGVVLMILAVTLHVGLLIGAHLRSARGRLDARRGLRVFATGLWASLLLGAGACTWLAHALLSPNLPDQTITLIDTYPTTQNPWMTVGAGTGDLGSSWVGTLQSFYGSWYTVNTETGEYRRLDNLARTSPFRRNTTAYTQSGNLVFLPTIDDGDLLLARLDLATGEATETTNPLTFGPTDQWWVSPDGKAIIDLWHEWSYEEGVPDGTLHIRASEIGSHRLLASYEGKLDSPVSKWLREDDSRHASLRWQTNSVAALAVHRLLGNFLRVRIDLERGSIVATARVRLDPNFLEPTSIRQKREQTETPPQSFRQPHWTADAAELWVATGPRIQAYAKTLSDDLQAPSRTIFTASDGYEVVHYQRDGDHLFVVTKNTEQSFGDEWQHQRLDNGTYTHFRDFSNTSGRAILLERSAANIWQPISTLALQPLFELEAQLDKSTYLLSPTKRLTGNLRCTEVLDFSSGRIQQTSVAQWLGKKGMPSSEAIYPETKELFTLNDQSAWILDPLTLEPKRLNLPAPIHLDFWWRQRL